VKRGLTVPEVMPRATKTIWERQKDRMDGLDPHRERIVVRRSGNRSTKACTYLAARGFPFATCGVACWRGMRLTEKEDRND